MDIDSYYLDNISELLSSLDIVQDMAKSHPTYDMSGNEFAPAYNLRNICWLIVERISLGYNSY